MTAQRVTRRGVFLAAGALTATSLGLSWSSVTRVGARTVVVHGIEHPARVFVVVAALLLLAALRRGSRRWARAAVLVGALALPIGLADGFGPGRAVFVVALLLAAVGAGVLPGPRWVSLGGAGQRAPAS